MRLRFRHMKLQSITDGTELSGILIAEYEDGIPFRVIGSYSSWNEAVEFAAHDFANLDPGVDAPPHGYSLHARLITNGAYVQSAYITA